MLSNIRQQCENLFRQSAAFAYRQKYWVVAVMLLLTAGLATQLGRLEIDTRDESFFHKNDPALIAYNDFKKQFGQDEFFLIALQPAQGLDTAFFNTLYRLHRELEESVPYIDKISSLVNGRIVRGDEDTLYVEELFPQPPQNKAETARIKELIDQYPLYENLLISPDRSTVSILIKAKALVVKGGQPEDVLAGFEQEEPEEHAERYLSNAESTEMTEAIEQVVATYQSPTLKVFFTGIPAVVTALQKGVKRDLFVILPFSVLLSIFFFALLYRRTSGVVYPLLIVLLSLVATFGFVGMLRIPATLPVSQILPAFLLVVGIADAVHILTIFYRNFSRCGDKQQAILDAMALAGLPVLMTSVTTACGLFSFLWADMAPVAQLGWVAPVGVFFALLYTVLLLPAFIALFPLKQGKKGQGLSENALSDRLFHGIARVTTRHPAAVTVLFSCFMLVSLYGIFNLRFYHNAATWFPEDSPARQAIELLDRVNGGCSTLEGVIDTGKENGLYDPDLLRRLDQAVTDISRLEVAGIRAGKVWAISDVLKETNRALHGNQDAAYTLPDSRELTAQELLLFEAGGSNDLQDFTDSRYRTARFSIIGPAEDSFLYVEYTDRVQQYLSRQFPDASVTLTGKVYLFAQLVSRAITTMAKSYSISLAVITLLMIAMVGGVRIGLLSMLANVAPILYVLGLMGMNDIPFDLSTMLIGSLVLGIVVDDTIHFFHHFQRAFEATANVELAIRETLLSTGKAMFITTMVLSSGFFMFTAGSLVTSVRFGIICGFAVLFALLADFFMVPALLMMVMVNRAENTSLLQYKEKSQA
ncbi:MAG: efflux RND transporter permease subunit [Candidatus Electrothrix sp. YB6]